MILFFLLFFIYSSPSTHANILSPKLTTVLFSQNLCISTCQSLHHLTLFSFHHGSANLRYHASLSTKAAWLPENGLRHHTLSLFLSSTQSLAHPESSTARESVPQTCWCAVDSDWLPDWLDTLTLTVKRKSKPGHKEQPSSPLHKHSIPYFFMRWGWLNSTSQLLDVALLCRLDGDGVFHAPLHLTNQEDSTSVWNALIF